NLPGTQDLSGEPTPNAPKWAASMTATYKIAIDDFTLTPSVTAIYSSPFFLASAGTDDPGQIQNAYWRIDGRLTLLRTGDHWALDLIGKNLSDANIATTGTDRPASTGS